MSPRRLPPLPRSNVLTRQFYRRSPAPSAGSLVKARPGFDTRNCLSSFRALSFGQSRNDDLRKSRELVEQAADAAEAPANAEQDADAGQQEQHHAAAAHRRRQHQRGDPCRRKGQQGFRSAHGDPARSKGQRFKAALFLTQAEKARKRQSFPWLSG